VDARLSLESAVIRRLDERDSLEALTELLHRAYAPLAALGFRSGSL